MAVKWLDDPEDHDYDAAADYLSMLAEENTVTATVDALESAKPVYRKPVDNPHVKSDLAKIEAGKKLSPILLVRGTSADAMQIADGYHRVCASFLTDENTAIPCRLVSWAHQA